MGVLNQNLGMNLTNEDPIIDNPFNLSGSTGSVIPPPTQGFFLELSSPLDSFLLLSGQFQTLL